MPELPDIKLYEIALNKLLAGKALLKVIVKSPFLMRTFDPPIEDVENQLIQRIYHLEKKLVWKLDTGHCLVFHLMIAGRFHWRAAGKLPRSKNDLAAFQFEDGTMMLTEASQKKRASLHLIAEECEVEQFRRGGLDLFECSVEQFRNQLQIRNRTLKRALTDPVNFSGVGNAYSDEILHHAQLSPLKRTANLTDEEIDRLFDSCRIVLQIWIDRLLQQAGDVFPEKVRAMRPEMFVHGRYGKPCGVCRKKVQRIRYAENECNYCPNCQTQGKLLADRSLSRLLKDDWPKNIDELE